MKLSHISAALLTLAAGAAHALPPGTGAGQAQSATTSQIHASGATALRNVVGGLFNQNCATGTLDVYYSLAGSAAGQGDAANGDSHRAYSCTLKAEADLDAEFQGKGLGGRNVTFYKTDRGGSGQGVQPIGSPAGVGSAVDRLDLTGCTATGLVLPAVPQYTCPNKVSSIPLLGVSDVEPELFVGINVPPPFNPGGLNTAERGALTVVPVLQTVFGVAVSTSLRNALQAVQSLTVGSDTEANRPSMPRSVAGALFRGELQDPANGLGWHSLGVANPDKQVNVCRRVTGSGTQAAANMYFSDFPCGPYSLNPATNADSGLPNDVNGPFTGSGFYVYEGSTTGNVISCLQNANTAGEYAVGHVSLENPETVGFKHVKIDGVSPNRANATAGRYDYVVESTMQYITAKVTALKASPSVVDQTTGKFVETFAVTAGLPKNLAALSTNNQNGVASLPDAGVYNPAANQTNVLNGGDLSRFHTRVTRGGLSCRPLSIVQ